MRTQTGGRTAFLRFIEDRSLGCARLVVIGAQDVVFTDRSPGGVGRRVGGLEWDRGGDQGGYGGGGAVDDGDCGRGR